MKFVCGCDFKSKYAWINIYIIHTINRFGINITKGRLCRNQAQNNNSFGPKYCPH